MTMNLEKTMTQTNALNTNQEYSVRDAIHRALTSYLAQLGNQQPTNIYEMVLSEVELPILDTIMRYTRNNQSRSAVILGLSRGTLRKLLKKHGFID